MNLDTWKLLLDGAWVTLYVSAAAIALGVPIGLLIAAGRVSKLPVLSQALAMYVTLARATPLVTLTLFIFLAAPSFGIQINRVAAAIMALTANTAAFNAEIWRSAFIGFAREQREAAYACGMTRWVFFRRIMLPQVIVNSLPALVSEMSFLIKASPAVAVIGIVDLTRVTNRITSVTYEPLPPILAAAVLYMLMIGGLLKLQQLLEFKARRLAV
ncbi:ABC transporter permease subunit [Pseudomonas sp. NPDC008258]|uniref:amino acid ABC transporter permease n=1 Tax=Pseudomonas TaxID=286 RepID=UPI0036E04A1A